MFTNIISEYKSSLLNYRLLGKTAEEHKGEK